MNYVLNLLKAEDGMVNFDAFLKFSRLSHLSIYSTLFLQSKESILQEMITSLPHFKVKQLFQKFFLHFSGARME